MLLFVWLGIGLLKTSPIENQLALASGPAQTAQALPPPAVSEGRPRPAPESQGGKFSTLPDLSAAKIVFYGKVIDQDGNPLSDVEVTGKTGSKVAFYTEEHRDYQTTTDAEGLFVFDQFQGDGLVIDLNKPGFEFASDHRNFLYSAITGDQKRHEPDQANPVVFTMFKSIGADPMVFHEKTFYDVSIDGKPFSIDLEKARRVQDGGDLSISLLWSDKNGLEARLMAPSGGLIEGGRDRMFMAPEAGYKNSIVFQVGNLGSFSKEIYLKTRNGAQYSRATISIRVRPADAAATFAIRLWLNPSGSRNLEYDPAKRVNR